MTYFVRLDLQQSLRHYWQAGKYRGDTSGIWGFQIAEALHHIRRGSYENRGGQWHLKTPPLSKWHRDHDHD